ncbi:hypothetical protein OAO03_05130, partial [Candidatus Pelagibacter ubique]|nr:hypothetical protein [Candidatus Pelagibacter ubique]
MKSQNNNSKSNFFKKIFVKICRLFNFEIIDQSSLYFPVSNKYINDELSIIGEKSITIPMGILKTSRPVRSLDIILRTCASVNMLSQSKKRLFDADKSEYTLRTLNSIIKSINNSTKIFNKINLKITIIDHNSETKVINQMKTLLNNQFFKSEIIDLKVENFKNEIQSINQKGEKVTDNQISNMSNIHQSLLIARNCEDLIYFVEDDYLHSINSIKEMILSYEKLSSLLKQELILCPTDYPYLYNKAENSKIFLGNNFHWRQIEESLCTFLTSNLIVKKYWEDLISVCKFEHQPFEKPFHDVYKKEFCLSPIPSLAIHCTNINSVYGLSPFINYKKIWEENEIIN